MAPINPAMGLGMLANWLPPPGISGTPEPPKLAGRGTSGGAVTELDDDVAGDVDDEGASEEDDADG